MERATLIHQLLLKVSRNYTLPHYDYEPALKDTVFDFATTVGDRASDLADRVVSATGNTASRSSSSQGQPETAPSLSHAFAKAALTSSELLGPEEPLGAAFKKFSLAQERVGRARISQDQDAVAKFHQPLLTGLETTIGQANVLLPCCFYS